MRALFWNMRGFGQDNTRRQLIDYIQDEHIDIVAVQETLRADFTLQELEHLSSHLFAWHSLPSSGTVGHSGGILLGVKDATFDIGSMDRGEFYVSMEIFERAIKFKWELWSSMALVTTAALWHSLRSYTTRSPLLLFRSWWEVTSTSHSVSKERIMDG
ncbi:hypothetical protein D1007_22786 [Hordeum vulgare]|nr:hypothetical protein D1007_22786 [Hordeum vulgare]